MDRPDKYLILFLPMEFSINDLSFNQIFFNFLNEYHLESHGKKSPYFGMQISVSAKFNTHGNCKETAFVIQIYVARTI